MPKIVAHVGAPVTAADLYAPGHRDNVLRNPNAAPAKAAPPAEPVDTTRGHAVSKHIPPAAPITDLRGKHPTKPVDVPPLHPGARGREMSTDPHYKRMATYDPAQGDRVLDSAVGSTPLPGRKHHSHTDNMRKTNRASLSVFKR